MPAKSHFENAQYYLSMFIDEMIKHEEKNKPKTRKNKIEEKVLARFRANAFKPKHHDNSGI